MTGMVELLAAYSMGAVQIMGFGGNGLSQLFFVSAADEQMYRFALPAPCGFSGIVGRK